MLRPQLYVYIFIGSEHLHFFDFDSEIKCQPFPVKFNSNVGESMYNALQVFGRNEQDFGQYLILKT